MVIRRIREHVAELNWFAVAIDFAIVVAGIVIGTQVNNWNELRIEAEQSRSYRARLIDELDFNARQYRVQIAYYRQVRANGIAALAVIEGRSREPARDFLMHAYQLSQIDTGVAKTYIYDEMTSAGLVDRLGDEAMQATASDYYLALASNDRVLKETLPYRSTIRQVMPYAAQHAIRDSCGDQFVYFGRRIMGTRLPEPCTATLAPYVAEKSALTVRSYPGLVSEMTRYIASIDEKIEVLTINLGLTEKFKGALASAA
ncbi:MAG: hypothetical protein ABIS38_09965 [Sphingomicrobium sp.]